uniref:Uncharacterized protein n=1 Tax=Romanomermis culicivorax TaxID=13658 RepID=A0A915KBC7_ROMCU
MQRKLYGKEEKYGESVIKFSIARLESPNWQQNSKFFTFVNYVADIMYLLSLKKRALEFVDHDIFVNFFIFKPSDGSLEVPRICQTVGP